MSKPKIRFKGYTDEWEQRKVKNIAPLQRGFDLPTSQMEEGVYPVVMSNGIGGHHSQYKVKGPGIVTGRSGTIGKLHYIEDDYWPHNTTLWVTDFYGNNQKFIYYMYQCLDLSRFSTGSGVPTLNRNDVHDEVVCIPSVGEQKKISDYLTNLDHLITLHQRKCEETKKLKKYMLQKMFPQNGMKTPEIRFEGFTDAWEQRKLGDVFVEYSEKNHSELPALTIIQGGGTVKREDTDRTLMYDKSNLSGYKMVRENDFIVHLRSFEGGLEKASSDGIISPAYHTFHGIDIDPRFYYPYFRSYEFIKHKLIPHVYGIRDGRSIDIEGMKTINIPYTSCEEQNKIGDYIESLDHLITLHQRKCDELQNIKKFMLQNMFV